MATMHRMLAFGLALLCIGLVQSEIVFQSLCSTEAQVPGLSSIDGSDEFEIDLYEDKYLPDDTILRKKKTSLFLLIEHDEIFVFRHG